MRDELKRLPFDERNERDFEELTRKIYDAITEIKKTRSIPATQEKLAEMVDCTRKTLHNRGWPITELKEIKDERKTNKDSKPKNSTADHRLSSENHIAREKLLIRQIRNLQEQNSKLFDRVQELEERDTISTEAIKMLEDEMVVLKNENHKLERDLRQLKQGHGSKTNIVSFRAGNKIKKAKRGKI